MARDAGKKIYGHNYAIDLNIEEGSLKARLTQLYVGATFILTAVGSYSDLKSSIKEIQSDSAAFAQYIYKNFFDAEGIGAANRVVKQNKKGVPGQLSIVIRDLEGLQQDSRGLSRRQIEEIIDRSRIRLAEISRQLTEDDARKLLSLLREGNLPGLPSNPSKMLDPVLFTRRDWGYSRRITDKVASSPKREKRFHKLIKI